MQSTAIIWLRRDLRLDDHFAFRSANDIDAKILPIFIFDKEILKNFRNKNDKRISFLIDRIKFLNKKLEKHNVQILTLHGNPVQILSDLIKNLKPTHLIAAAGYEAYDIDRDQKVSDICKKENVNFLTQNDHLIFPPDTVLKNDGTPYEVFTPYSRKLYQQINDTTYAEYKVKEYAPWKITLPAIFDNSQLNLNDNVNTVLNQIGYEYIKYDPWNIEFENTHVKKFISNLSTYQKNRNFPHLQSTSQFSPYLRFGFISIRQCLRISMGNPEAYTWISELIWRDFYAMALFFYPECQSQERNKKYRSLEWNKDKNLFEKFSNGQTGYPIVDAAMRQLKEIGWVHNRCRMIAASFLTKHLLLDWRMGEELYSQYLMDYELSSNVGGWQWAASTGFDAQPYFRIFNPYLQSKKFDPEGLYIKKYVKELKNVPAKYIHEPKKYDSSLNYPDPIVNHEIARKCALEFYRS